MSEIENKTELTKLNENIEELISTLKNNNDKLIAALLACTTSSSRCSAPPSFPLEEYTRYKKVLEGK